jgi:hypothetical protein
MTKPEQFRSTIPAESYENAVIERHGARIGDFNKL